MQFKVAILAVNGNEKLRPYKREHKFQLLLAGVSRNVDIVGRIVDDVRAEFVKIVDDVVYAALVAGDRRCGNNDGVRRRNRNFVESALRHSGKRAHRLALTARAKNGNALRREFVGFVDIDDKVFRERKFVEFRRHIDDVFHAAPA